MPCDEVRGKFDVIVRSTLSRDADEHSARADIAERFGGLVINF
jgi:hypothetical protein